ncbi:hypothetical protein NC99_26350 [Sunxiuqinia dokdonensis]|uniref:Uncharacterized protein n=1 Tax=Sunxiuqinia dokdonensis TaxID=1409788 RepID=A0A0L8V7Y5_9BACT|nr:hypothetical protein NC99_26350 [Sunxiuqinia dokdonensis]
MILRAAASIFLLDDQDQSKVEKIVEPLIFDVQHAIFQKKTVRIT